MAADEEHARTVAFRDLGNAIALLAGGDPRPAPAQRAVYDFGDFLHLAPRKPFAAVLALSGVALCGLALAAK